MEKINLLIENALSPKEKIASSIITALINRSYYNSNEMSSSLFNGILSKMKRIHGVSDITPKKYFEIKRNVGELLNEIRELEKPYISELNELAEVIIRNYYNVPKSIKFDFNSEDNDYLNSKGINIIDEYKDKYEDLKFDDYTGINAANSKIDRDRMNYSLICGGANQGMGLYKKYADVLDGFDYRFYELYDKFTAFNNFNLWVTPDDILHSNTDDIGGVKIFDNNGEYKISVESPNFLTKLYEMSKAVLSILFQEKYNNPYVDYDNPWNTRLGSLAWQKFIGCANKKKHFPYVVDAMNKLDDDDYIYTMKEVLAGTTHSKKIFEELYKTF